jgi:hypothetical protein
VLVLGGDVAEDRLAHRVQLAVGVEESHDALGLLKRLNEPIEENPIEAPIREADAVVVMLLEGVHGNLQVSQPEGYVHERRYER